MWLLHITTQSGLLQSNKEILFHSVEDWQAYVEEYKIIQYTIRYIRIYGEE